MNMLKFFTEYSSVVNAMIICGFLTFILGQAFLGRWLANEKCRDQGTWFWLCLFFGIPALLALGFSPTIDIRKIAQKIEASNSYDMSVMWKCPKCNMENPNNLYVCKTCGYKLA